MTNRTGASGSMYPHADKMLKAARAYRGSCEPSAKELSAARHLAHEGATWQEIAAALNWSHLTKVTVRLRLKKFNIIVRYNASKKEKISARFTAIRHYPKEGKNMDARSWRPKLLIPAQA